MYVGLYVVFFLTDLSKQWYREDTSKVRTLLLVWTSILFSLEFQLVLSGYLNKKYLAFHFYVLSPKILEITNKTPTFMSVVAFLSNNLPESYNYRAKIKPQGVTIRRFVKL